MDRELAKAHEMQMSLMPVTGLRTLKFDVAGRCLPASHVGGDYFQYNERDGHLRVSLADVTGHAMEAAIPAVLFSGVLESQEELGGDVGDLFGRLNRSMCGTLGQRTFVCFVMGELDSVAGKFHLANGGCPYPYHYRNGEISEIQMDTYPLGITQRDTV